MFADVHHAPGAVVAGVEPGAVLRGDQARKISVPLPAMLLPSVTSPNISCKYRVHVSMPAGMMTSQAKLDIPITLNMPDPAHTVYTQPPDYWKPTVRMHGLGADAYRHAGRHRPPLCFEVCVAFR